MHDVSICLLNRPDFPRDLEASKEAPSRQGLISPLLADSVEKVGLAAACRSGVPAVEVAASHFRLPFGVSLSVLAQV